jgi:DNA-binding LytR/AlgR family response regulator
MINGTEVTAIIVDDELLLAKNLEKRLLILWPELRILQVFSDSREALNYVNENSVDIIFLDINMPYLNGLEFANKLKNPSRIVFVTAYSEYAVKAFELHALDYVVKPVEDERLTLTISKIKHLLLSEKPSIELYRKKISLLEQTLKKQQYTTNITVNVGSMKKVIPVAGILYFESDGKYSKIAYGEQEYLINTTLKQLEKELDPKLFWRVHRSYIVNINAIEKSQPTMTGRLSLTLKNHTNQLTVSRAYLHLFKAK